jgi:hypothetical protein
MNFRLEKQSATRALVKFRILNSGGELCGSVSVPPSQEAALLASWKGGTTPPAAKAAKAAAGGKAAIVAALKRGPRLSKAALLRGC